MSIKHLPVPYPSNRQRRVKNGPLEWRGNGGVTWKRGAWTMGWNMQFYDSYQAYNALDSAGTILQIVGAQGSRSIPGQMYHDLSVRYVAPDGPVPFMRMLSGAQIQLGIQNVFDTWPPVVASGGIGYSGYGDPRLRRYSLSLTARF